MIRRLHIPLAVLLALILILVIPAQAHVPVSADNNHDLSTALSIEYPQKSYAIYGNLHDAGGAAYYQLRMQPGDRLVLSLMNNGYGKPVPDMIVMGPDIPLAQAAISPTITIPNGYGAALIPGHQPLRAEYEPFSPGVISEVANYSQDISSAGTWYVAVVSPADETQYSLAVGYREEFSPVEWALVPVSLIETHLGEGPFILEILAPLFAVVILGFILIGRRVQRQGKKPGIAFWTASIAGLLYLGGAAMTFVQMLHAVNITGYTPGIPITLLFVLVPAVLGLSALRIARQSWPWTMRYRIYLLIIGIAGLIFWAGMVLGPVLAVIAALVPDR